MNNVLFVYQFNAFVVYLCTFIFVVVHLHVMISVFVSFVMNDAHLSVHEMQASKSRVDFIDTCAAY